MPTSVKIFRLKETKIDSSKDSRKKKTLAGKYKTGKKSTILPCRDGTARNLSVRNFWILILTLKQEYDHFLSAHLFFSLCCLTFSASFSFFNALLMLTHGFFSFITFWLIHMHYGPSRLSFHYDRVASAPIANFSSLFRLPTAILHE